MNWIPLAIFLAVFVGTVVGGLIIAPYWIYAELQQDRNKLRAALDKRTERRAAIGQLWQLRAEGVPHRNQGIQAAELPAWVASYEAWRTQVLAQALIVSDGLQAWLSVLDRMEPPPAFSSQSVGPEHQNKRHIMSEILLSLQRFLEAEMLNKDIARTEY